MSDITIYSNQSSLETFSSTNYTLEQLLEQHKTAITFGNKAKIAQCCILYKIKDTLYSKHKSEQTKAYKDEATQICVALKMRKSQLNRDAAVGRYVMQQNDISLFDKPKSAIESLFIQPKLPVPVKPKKKRESDTVILFKSDYDYLKRESMYYQALMNLMGDRADSILEKALKSKS